MCLLLRAYSTSEDLHFEFRKLLVLRKFSLPLCLWLGWLHLSHQVPVHHGKPRFCQPDENKGTYTVTATEIQARPACTHVSLLGHVYLVTPPKTTAPTTSPLQPSNQRPTMRFVAALGAVAAAWAEEAPVSAVMVLWPLLTSHCRSCGLWWRWK